MKISRERAGDVLDGLLDGGIEKGVVSTIYGPAASGKTTAAMILSKFVAGNKKVFFVDTEGGFSVERFSQLGDESLLKNILLLKPLNFEEQMKSIETVTKNINERIGLIVVDTISALYRLEKSRNLKEVNNMLNLQLSWLTEAARRHNIPVFLTAQVYSDFEDKDKVRIVGGDFIKYSAKCLIELTNEPRKAIIRKHRSLPENKEIEFKIVSTGFEKV